MYVNDSLLYSQDNCWPMLDESEESDLLKLVISNSYDHGPSFDYVSVDEF